MRIAASPNGRASVLRQDLVRAAGLEPARPFGPGILSAMCLPFHHARPGQGQLRAIRPPEGPTFPNVPGQMRQSQRRRPDRTYRRCPAHACPMQGRRTATDHRVCTGKAAQAVRRAIPTPQDRTGRRNPFFPTSPLHSVLAAPAGERSSGTSSTGLRGRSRRRLPSRPPSRRRWSCWPHAARPRSVRP